MFSNFKNMSLAYIKWINKCLVTPPPKKKQSCDPTLKRSSSRFTLNQLFNQLCICLITSYAVKFPNLLHRYYRRLFRCYTKIKTSYIYIRHSSMVVLMYPSQWLEALYQFPATPPPLLILIGGKGVFSTLFSLDGFNMLFFALWLFTLNKI